MQGFELLRKLADGSAAEAFLARDGSSQSRVVLEVIRPELCEDMELYGRFLDEAKRRRQLKHPHLLRLQTAGCDESGRVYVATEPVDGEHLGSWLLANGPLSPSQLVRVVLPICEALEYLHERGLVHGHLRPSNVFLFGSGARLSAKLLDTGLTLFRSTRSVESPSTRVLVEPEYLCPERIRGSRANALSDVYGMGVLMYEALCGRPPFSAPEPSITRTRHLEQQPPALPSRAERLETIVLRCLAKEPSRRYPSIGALRQALAWHAGDSASISGPRTIDSSELVDLDSQTGLPVIEGEPLEERIGSYELGALLGQGGMGEVYLGRHALLGRTVALKLLKPDLADDPAQLKRFFLEGQAIARINHPHIVELFDFVEEPKELGGRVYYVMEALQGRTLRQEMKAAPLNLERGLRIVRQVCSALGAAHQAGVVHRDVKPENVFLTRKGDLGDFVKLLDFGVAKLKAPSPRFAHATQAGIVVGTPSFMAPEQALGEPVDARADVYSVGTILYAIVCGHPPFQASGLGPLLAKVVTKPAPPLPERSASGEPVPEALRALVAKCLQKAPSDRVQSMAELDGALSELLRRRPTPPEALAQAPVKLAPRPRVLGWGLPLALLAAGLLLAAYAWLSAPEPEGRPARPAVSGKLQPSAPASPSSPKRPAK